MGKEEQGGLDMPRPLVLLLLMALLILQTPTEAAAPTRNCDKTCGGINVPYPFGLHSDVDEGNCPLLGGYKLRCIDSYHPPKLFSGNIEVIGININISSGQLRILLSTSYVCYNSSSGSFLDYDTLNVTLTQKVLSSTENKFTVVGCDSIAVFKVGTKNYRGCTSGCDSVDRAVDGDCTGFGCCQASVPKGVKSYVTDYYERKKGSEVYTFNPCTFFFIAEKDNYTFHTSDLMNMDKNRQFPVILDWFIGNSSCEEAARNESSYACVAGNSVCVNSTSGGAGYLCKCKQGYQGNPYVLHGCADIDECQDDHSGKYPCNGICTNTIGGYDCRCPKGFQSKDPKTEECLAEAKLSPILLLAIGIGGGLLLLSFIGTLSCLEYQRRKIKALRDKHFKSNGGVFLRDLVSAHQSTFRIFSFAELKKATNNFSKANIVGRGGFGIVYKGETEDHIPIAVKKSTMVNEKNSRGYANELFILSQVNHSNIVKLLGCCLEDEMPVLVYEFISGGTLFDYIHSDHERSIGLNTRLQIATKVAEAFKYLHLDASPPILHGDVKSANILLDEDFQPKVSDFGTSKLAPNDNTKFTTLVQGTCGYLDPEYLTTGALTDKSDVFGFGVVLLELLTRKYPLNFTADSDVERILYVNFLSCVKTNKLLQILDPVLVEQGLAVEVEMLAEIASDCLKMEGEKRPTMKEVALRLGSIKVSEEVLASYPSSSHGTKETKPLLEGPSTTSSFARPQQVIFSVEMGR